MKKLDFKDIRLPVIIRDIHKLERKNVSTSAFLVITNREKCEKNLQSTFQKILLKDIFI